jgi:hypothetical protein
MYITCKGAPMGNMTKHTSILGREAYLGFYFGEMPCGPKYW